MWDSYCYCVGTALWNRFDVYIHYYLVCPAAVDAAWHTPDRNLHTHTIGLQVDVNYGVPETERIYAVGLKQNCVNPHLAMPAAPGSDSEESDYSDDGDDSNDDNSNNDDNDDGDDDTCQIEWNNITNRIVCLRPPVGMYGKVVSISETKIMYTQYLSDAELRKRHSVLSKHNAADDDDKPVLGDLILADFTSGKQTTLARNVAWLKLSLDQKGMVRAHVYVSSHTST